MNKLIHLLLLITVVAHSQIPNMDMKPEPEYLSYQPLYVYAPKDGKYLKNYLNILYNKETGAYSTELTSPEIVDIKNLIATNPKIYDFIVPFSEVRQANYKTLIAELEGLEFSDPQNSEFKHFTMNFVDGYALHNCCRQYGGKPYYGGTYYNIVPVTINKAKTILYLMKDNTISGYVLPLKDKFYLKLYGEHVNAVAHPFDNKALKKHLSTGFPSGKSFVENGRTGMKADNFAASVTIPAVYDSIKVMGGNYVAAYSKGRPTLLYNNGEPAVSQQIRAAYNNGGDISVLANGKRQWLLADGVLGDQLPMREGCGTVPHVTDSIIIKNGYFIDRNIYQYGERRVTDQNIIKADTYKHLEFLNQSIMKDEYYMGTVQYMLPNDHFIATSSAGKRIIVKISYGGTDVVVQELFDITGYKILTNNLYEPLRFTADGLTGVWPQGKKAKYKKLGIFEKGFARFEYPDGKAGWLCLDGNEYFDE